ncbi:hypothetical protein NPIL_538911, partial [Nephila pilipes]
MVQAFLKNDMISDAHERGEAVGAENNFKRYFECSFRMEESLIRLILILYNDLDSKSARVTSLPFTEFSLLSQGHPCGDR